MKNSTKVIVGVIVLFMLIFGIMVSKLDKSNTESILNQEGNGTIKLIREAREGRKVSYQIIELENGDTFKINNSLTEKIHVGDSVYKKKGELFYTVVDAKTKNTLKINL